MPDRSRPGTRVALFGFLGSGNIGNDASLETVLAWLRRVDPHVRPRCITISPQTIEARYGIPAVALSAAAQPPGTPRARAALGKVLGRLADLPRSWRAVGSVDTVLVPGMGVLEDTLGIRPWGMPLWLVLYAAVCRARRRRFVLLDVGAEPAPRGATRPLYVAAVRLAHHVSYRDEWSAEAMRACGAREPDAIAPDLAFAHPDVHPRDVEPGRIVIGVMAYYGVHDDPVRGAEVHRRYVATMAAAAGRLVAAGDHVVLVGGDQVDLDVARAIRAAALAGGATGRIDVREIERFDELGAEMARAEVVVASRFHNLICALRAGRPTISLGYATKNRRLMSAAGLDQYCQDIDAVDADHLLASVTAARADAAELSARIGAMTAEAAVRVHALLDAVAIDLGYRPEAVTRAG